MIIINNKYKNEFYDIEIDYPETWQLKEDIYNTIACIQPNPNYLINLVGSDTVILPNINLMIYPVQNAKLHTHKILNRTIDDLSKYITEFKIKSRIITTKSDDLILAELNYSGMAEKGLKLVFKQNLYFYLNKVFSLTCTSECNIYSYVKNDFNKILESFKILDEE
ncbi:PsbP-related protein [Paenibacillus sp. FSL M7-0896]|uniref:PsbP-related protein n=1 Tax=Paenibacillus sp. FSL M7-0896 TaxID=2921610 RepID=UPI0030DC5574